MNNNNSNLIPFSLEAAKNGAKVVTRLGYPVRIITVSNNGEIIAVVEHGLIHRRTADKWNIDGSKYSSTSEHYMDLFIAA